MKQTCLLTILLLALLTANAALAYPPDNAAVLYYKNMEFFQKADDAVGDQISNLPTSSEPASEQVKAFIEKNRNLITELQTASTIEHCDWGLDYSQGFEMMMPGLSAMKNFSYLVLSDAAIDAAEGDVSTALEKNLVVRRMGHHITNDTLIGFLVSFSMNKKSDEALQHLLATYPVDKKTLVDFKNELLWERYRPKPIRHPLMMEKEVCLLETEKITPERYKRLVADWEKNENSDRLLDLLENNDPTFLKLSIVYLEKYYDRVFAIMEKPYVQAYPQIGAELEKAARDAAKGRDEAVFTDIFCPALAKCYNHGITWKTNYDAMLTALDVYIATAKMGKLPAELPQSTYIDHFSGKPFIYEVTDDRFTLRCQQEDQSKKTIHEFKYKLPQ